MQAANNNADNMQQGRPQLMRRRSSIEFKVSQEANPSRKGKTMLLSVIPSSTLALFTSIFCAYAWFFTIGVGSSYLTFSLIESSQETLLSFKREQQEFHTVLEVLQTQTQIARRELQRSTTTCMHEDEIYLYDGDSFISQYEHCAAPLWQLH